MRSLLVLGFAAAAFLTAQSASAQSPTPGVPAAPTATPEAMASPKRGGRKFENRMAKPTATPAAKPAATPAATPAAAATPAPVTSAASPAPTKETKEERKAAAKAEMDRMAQATPAPGGGPGMVWVNTKSKVYHMPDSTYYGKTKHGKYMTEEAAKAEGDHLAKASPIGKKKDKAGQ